MTSRPSPFMFHKPISLLAEDVKVEVNDPMKSGYHREDIPIGVVPYFINKGDTFESICDSIYGDASLARELQIRTGLLANKRLAPGQLIYLPKLIPTHHKPGMMRPYHELRGLLTGRLLPHLTTPLPKAHHTSFLGNLAKIIAVALIIAFAPAFAGLVLGLSGLSAVVVAAGFAAIGDAAVQGVAIGVGIQEKFSFNEVIETAASTAAVTAVGPMTKNATHLVASAEKALSVATAQVSSQLTEMKLNLRDKFNARDVVSQVAATIIGDEISTYAEDNLGTSTAAKTTTKIVSSVASSAAGTRVTHTPFNIQNAVSNAVGNATGSSVSEHVQSRITTSHDQNTTHHRTAPAHTSADRQATTHRPAKNETQGWGQKHVERSAASVPDELGSQTMLTKAFGLARAVFGLAEVTAGFVGGTLGVETGVAPIVGGLVMTHGMDEYYTGMLELRTGKTQSTTLKTVVQYAGASPKAASFVDTAAGFLMPMAGVAKSVAFQASKLGASALRQFGVWRAAGSRVSAANEVEALGVANKAQGAGKGVDKLTPEVWGRYRVERGLPRDPRTKMPVPDSGRPHTQIGQKHGSKGTYTQAREWGYDEDGKLVHKKDIDFTDHGRPDIHPNPHQHTYIPNATGGTLRRNPNAESIKIEVIDAPEFDPFNKFTR